MRHALPFLVHVVRLCTALPFEDSGHFDAVAELGLPTASEIDLLVEPAAQSWLFSLWQHRATENVMDFQTGFRDRSIVHLTARPLQVYYHDDFENGNLSQAPGQQICRVTVSTKDVYHSLHTEATSINVLFVCSTGRCCGLDCCHLNVAFVFALSCISLALACFAIYFAARSLRTSRRRLRRMLPCFGVGRPAKVIRRANCQRKVRNSDREMRAFRKHAMQEDEVPVRKKSQSVKLPHRYAIEDELLLAPNDLPQLTHTNSFPSNYRERNDVLL